MNAIKAITINSAKLSDVHYLRHAKTQRFLTSSWILTSDNPKGRSNNFQNLDWSLLIQFGKDK